MKTAGMWLTAVGGLTAIGALLFMPTSIETSVPSSLGYGITDRSTILNIGLLQQQELVFLGGCTLFLGGIVLWAAGLIEDALRRIFRRMEPAAAAGMAEDAVPAHDPDVSASDVPTEWRLAEPDDDRWPIWKVLMVPLAVGLAMIFAIVIIGKTRQPEATAIENAAMIADNMEAEADNMDATNR